MPPLLGLDAYQCQPTIVEIAHETVLGLRREAVKRETTVERLAKDLLDVIAADNLVAAVLDDQYITMPLTPCRDVDRSACGDRVAAAVFTLWLT
jgi:hypothetical protein